MFRTQKVVGCWLTHEIKHMFQSDENQEVSKLKNYEKNATLKG